MNAQETARYVWATKQVANARKAEAAAKAAWVANSTTANWQAWQDAEDRTEAVRKVSDVACKQYVMPTDAMCAW